MLKEKEDLFMVNTIWRNVTKSNYSKPGDIESSKAPHLSS